LPVIITTSPGLAKIRAFLIACFLSKIFSASVLSARLRFALKFLGLAGQTKIRRRELAHGRILYYNKVY